MTSENDRIVLKIITSNSYIILIIQYCPDGRLMPELSWSFIIYFESFEDLTEFSVQKTLQSIFHCHNAPENHSNLRDFKNF